MTDEQFTRIASSVVKGIREDTPRDTGNLADIATNDGSISHGKWYISVSVRKAPYFHYVNERKEPCKRHGESHYHYFENALDKQIEIIARKAGGYVKRG